MNLSISAIAAMLSLCLFIVGCGKKEEMPSTQTVDVICSYAPSQSNLVSHASAVAGGSAAVAASIALAVGLTAVLHSSGAYIFTGASGYVAGTIGGAVALPATVTIGVVVAGSAVSLELVCAAKNHRDLVAKVESSVSDFAARTGRSIESTVKATEPLIADTKSIVVKAGTDAFDYAGRTSVEWSQVIRKKVN